MTGEGKGENHRTEVKQRDNTRPHPGRPRVRGRPWALCFPLPSSHRGSFQVREQLLADTVIKPSVGIYKKGQGQGWEGQGHAECSLGLSNSTPATISVEPSSGHVSSSTSSASRPEKQAGGRIEDRAGVGMANLPDPPCHL